MMATAVDAELKMFLTTMNNPGLFIPVLHETDLPFSGDLLCGALCGEGRRAELAAGRCG